MTAKVTYSYEHKAGAKAIIDGNGFQTNSIDATALSDGTILTAFNSGGSLSLHHHSSLGSDLGPQQDLREGLSTYDPSIAQLKNGNTVVAFTDQDASGSIVRVNILDKNGNAVGHEIVQTFGGGTSSNAQVTVLSNGNFVVTNEYDAVFPSGTEEKGVLTFTYDANGKFVGGFAEGAILSTDSDKGPDVAALAGGGFVQAYTAKKGGETSIIFRLFNSKGESLLGKVADADGGVNKDVTVTGLKDGGFALAYVENADDGKGLLDVTLKLFNADGSARTGSISSDAGLTAGTQSSPALTTLSNGFVMLSWTTSEAGGTTQFSVFDTSGKMVLKPTEMFGDAEHVTKAVNVALEGGEFAQIGIGHNAESQTYGQGDMGAIVRTSIGDNANETITGDDLVDHIDGNGGNDVLKGLGGRDTLLGGAGNDTLDGGKGADTMSGGAGNDTYLVDDAKDLISEAQQDGTADTVLTSVSYALRDIANVEVLKTTNAAGTGAINLTGAALAQTLVGNNGSNVLDGKGGADTMQGLNGNDTYVVDNAGDKVVEAANGGTDTVHASVSYALAANIETLKLDGAANINATGNASANTIVGNAGVNVLTGLGGNDTFVFTSLPATGKADHIADFANASGNNDVFRLDDVGFSLKAGALAADAFFLGTKAHDASDRIVYNKATGDLFFDADGSGAKAAVLLANVDNHASLTAADFIVV